jgi:hypothetical protein
MDIEIDDEVGVVCGRDCDLDRGRGRVPVSLERSWPTMGAVSTCDDMLMVAVV